MTNLKVPFFVHHILTEFNEFFFFDNKASLPSKTVAELQVQSVVLI